MILFNTTYCVDKPVAEDFIAFIRTTYIPTALQAGLYSPLITEVRGTCEPNALTGVDTRTFAVQLRVPSEETFEKFRSETLPDLYTALGKAFGSSIALFESTLDVIHEPTSK